MRRCDLELIGMQSEPRYMHGRPEPEILYPTTAEVTAKTA